MPRNFRLSLLAAVITLAGPSYAAEARPYGDDADNARKLVMEWLTDAPDVKTAVAKCN